MHTLAQRFAQHKVCVIIPTYNNAATLARVLDSVLVLTPDILVVNDGSTDATPQILANYPQITQTAFEKNCGKGVALRVGFEKAREQGYDYAITIDSDGQHFASDLVHFLEALEVQGEALYIGSRKMDQENVPKKSSFGNKFSNFWFWVETGIRLTDTQSGFRLYPLHKIPKKLYSTKFELEIEVIVRTSWRGVPVKNIPIKVLYDPDERVSHFRPMRDFSRISVLNTILVLITLLYILPRNLIFKLRSKGLKRFFFENVLKSDDSNSKKAASIALGVFIGICPFWGFQTLLVLFLAAVFRLNKIMAFAFSNISMPPLTPVVIFASLKLGEWLYPGTTSFAFSSDLTFEQVKDHLLQYLIGSFTLATITAAVFGIGAYALLANFTKFQNNKA